MSDSGGHTCPECGAPRGPDRSPSCDCTERAAEALRETRTAEAAAAEDFDPLRIRPYVEVVEAHAVERAEVRPVPPVTGGSPDARTRSTPAAETTLPLRPVPGASAADLRMFEDDGTDGPDGANGTGPAVVSGGAAEPPGGEAPRRRTRRAVLLSVAGAGMAVVAAAGFASGLFSYRTPARDPAAQEVRESVPDVSAPAPTSPTASPPSPTVSRAPVPPSRFTPTPRPSPPSTRPTPTPASPAPTASAATSHPASPTPATTVSAAVAPVLQRGDRGPEVTELQYRLWQLGLYDDRIDGVYTRPVEDAVRTYQLARDIQDDTLGVYGRATRESLEAETEKP
ncbi:peptidoglycan-binding protein [Streptomyces sp. NPDC002586]